MVFLLQTHADPTHGALHFGPNKSTDLDVVSCHLHLVDVLLQNCLQMLKHNLRVIVFKEPF